MFFRLVHALDGGKEGAPGSAELILGEPIGKCALSAPMLPSDGEVSLYFPATIALLPDLVTMPAHSVSRDIESVGRSIHWACRQAIGKKSGVRPNVGQGRCR